MEDEERQHLLGEIAKRDAEIAILKQTIDALCRRVFGKSSEQLDASQHCVWTITPFGRLNALPPDGRPITKYTNINEGFSEVVKGVQLAASSMSKQVTTRQLPPPPPDAVVVEIPRSANLHVLTEVTQRQKDQFVIDTFDYIARFFENSLTELPARNPTSEVETRFERIDSTTFSAVIYKRGKTASECTISRRPGLMGDIGYSGSLRAPTNSINDSLCLQEKEGTLSFKPLLAMGLHRIDRDLSQLSMEGAAQYYWDRFFEPLQR